MATSSEKPKKKRVNSKAKGSGNELAIAKLLSKALAPLNFGRTQGSGARVGGVNFETAGQLFGEDALKLFVGDVVPLNERDTGLELRWSIEAKFYKTPDTFPQLIAGKGNFFGWFNEAIVDAKKIDRLPMLIFKWNQTPQFVAVPSRENTCYPIPETDRKITIEAQDLWLDIYLLEDLLYDHPGNRDFWVKDKPTD